MLVTGEIGRHLIIKPVMPGLYAPQDILTSENFLGNKSKNKVISVEISANPVTQT